ncbi:MAG: hypothetical protein HYU37_09275 [Acidobacteria bacterium]|nr:hypothetical protein [Acidobacteriota bacterium]
MLITYRRTGGLFALLTLAAFALAATVLTIAVAATVLIVAVAIAAAARVGRAVLPRAWRNRTVPSATPWPYQTIDATAVNATMPSQLRPRFS